MFPIIKYFFFPLYLCLQEQHLCCQPCLYLKNKTKKRNKNSFIRMCRLSDPWSDLLGLGDLEDLEDLEDFVAAQKTKLTSYKLSSSGTSLLCNSENNKTNVMLRKLMEIFVTIYKIISFDKQTKKKNSRKYGITKYCEYGTTGWQQPACFRTPQH